VRADAVLRRLRHPVDTSLDVVGRVAPAALFRAAAWQARRSGITDVRLIVSLDCDTTRDIDVAADVHDRLRALGVRPTYAVAGELLEHGAEVWQAIAADGAEFLNHGGRAHARWDAASGTVESTFFYDQASAAEVVADVDAGDAAVRSVLDVAPRGFRTPHFGTFQRRDDLRALHAHLRSLGYRYSTSTLPAWGYRSGPVVRAFALPELPVTGFPSRPLQPLDTWACFAAPDRVLTPDDYVREARRLAQLSTSAGAGVLNLYGDPFHVAGDTRFDDAIAALVDVARPVTYGELLDDLA
jgi:hypothetical protein